RWLLLRRTQTIKGAVFFEIKSVRGANRRTAVAAHIPRQTDARSEVFPIGVPQIRPGFLRVSSVVVLHQFRVSGIDESRRRIDEYFAADTLPVAVNIEIRHVRDRPPVIL